ncbi:MAG: hypothetical protein WCV84_04040 [Patescibacteria group bacterium]
MKQILGTLLYIFIVGMLTIVVARAAFGAPLPRSFAVGAIAGSALAWLVIIPLGKKLVEWIKQRRLTKQNAPSATEVRLVEERDHLRVQLEDALTALRTKDDPFRGEDPRAVADRIEATVKGRERSS